MVARRTYPVVVAVIMGALWRLWLMGRYAGWEESDYGNLAMIQGVVDGGFLHYDMNHMPGYYALAAIVHTLVHDAVIAGRSVSFLGGVIALGLAVRIAVKIGGLRAGWVAAILLSFQPEFALYAASSLREPVAAAFFLGALSSLGGERLRLAGWCAAGAFLVRFDAVLVLGPLLLVHAFGKDDPWRRSFQALVPLAVCIFAWALYCRIDHGTWVFWSHSVQVNLETGLGAEAEQPGHWWLNGAKVAMGLFAWLLPWRMGWLVWLGLMVGAVAALRGPHGLLRTLGLQSLLMVGMWVGIGFVGQHAPTHNLYWKWLMPVIPVVIPLGVFGLWRLSETVGRVTGRSAGLIFVGLGLLQASASSLRETERQRQLSEDWYRPQLELARWIETELPTDTVMILDNIPACWIRRRPNQRTMISWFDVPSKAGDEEDFVRWLNQQNVTWVLWFREEWTQAPKVAPFLSAGGSQTIGDTQLREEAREDGYGWIWYRVLANPGSD